MELLGRLFFNFDRFLQQHHCDEVCSIWVKYFTSTKKLPKDFCECAPEFAAHIELFKFTPIDIKIVKQEISKLTNPNEIREKLLTLMPFENPLQRQFFDLTKLQPGNIPEPAVTVIFEGFMRFFCHLTNAMPGILRDAGKGDNESIEDVNKTQRLIMFFTQFPENLFGDFLIALKPMTDSFSSCWDGLIATQNSRLIGALAGFIMGLVLCVEVESRKQTKTIDSFYVSFIIEQLSKVLGVLSGEMMTIEIYRQLKGVLVVILTVVGKLSERDRGSLLCLLINILGKVSTFNIDPMDCYRLGVFCLKSFCDCSQTPDSVAEDQLDVIVDFIMWSVSQFADDSFATTAAFQMTKATFETFHGHLLPKRYLAKQPGLKRKLDVPCGQLNSILDKIVSLQRQEVFEYVLVSILESMSQLKSGVEYRTCFAFVLSLIEELDYSIVFRVFDQKWEVLFCEYLYPFDPWSLEFPLARDLANEFLYKCYQEVELSRDVLLEQIAKYVERSGERESIYHFWPLITELLKSFREVSFLRELLKSSLIEVIYKLSVNDMAAFDVLRICALLDPIECFSDERFLAIMKDSFFDPNKESSVLGAYSNCLLLTQEGSDSSHMNVVRSLKELIDQGIENNVKSAGQVFQVFENCAQCFSDKLAKFCQELGVFDAAGKLALHFPDLFGTLIRFIRTLTQQQHVFLNLLVSDEPAVYDMLESGIKAGLLGSEGMSDLLTMTILTIPIAGSVGVVRNYRGLELLLIYASRSKAEEEVVKQVAELASHAPNIPEFNRGKVIELILLRIKEAPRDTPIPGLYLDLFKGLSSSMFTVSTLYKTIELVKSEDFLYPDEVLEILLNLLSSPLSSLPSSYFVFDQYGGGIFPPPVNVGDSFTLCCSIRPKWTESTEYLQPFLNIIGNNHENTLFVFRNNKLAVTKRDMLLAEFPFVFRRNNWYFITLTISPEGYTLRVNSETMKINNPVKLANPVTLMIGARSPEGGVKNMIAGMSSVFVFRTTDVSLMKPRMRASNLPKELVSSLLLSFDPANAQSSGILVDVSPKIPQVQFSGKFIPFVSTVHDVLPSTGALSNVIPLFTRLSGDVLPVDTGKNLLRILCRLIAKIIALSESSQMIFSSIHGFGLLASFLMASNEKYFDVSILGELQNLFYSLTVFDLKVRMTEAIWLNFDLSRKFGDAQEIYFSSSVVLAYQEDHDGVFATTGSFDFVVYQAVCLFPDECKSGIGCWSFIRKFFGDNLTPALLQTLLTVALANKSSFSTLQAMTSVKSLCRDIKIDDPDQLRDILMTTVATMQFHDVRGEAFDILDQISRNNPSPIYQEALIAAAELITFEDIEDGRTTIESRMYKDDGTIVPQYLPLYFKCLRELSSTRQSALIETLTLKISLSPAIVTKITEMDHWYVHMLCLTEDSSFAKFYAHIIGISMNQTNSNSSLLEFLDFLSIQERSYRKLKSLTLESLLSSERLCPKAMNLMIEPVFEFIVFTYTPNSTTKPAMLIATDPDTNEWVDMRVGEALLKNYHPGEEDLTEENVLRLAYIAGLLTKYGNDRYLNKIVETVCDVSVKDQALSIIAHFAGKPVEEMFPRFTRNCQDSSELEFSRFVDAQTKELEHKSNYLSKLKSSVEEGNAALKRSIIEEKERHELNAKKFMERQQLCFDANADARKKLRDSFMDSFCIGPWRKECDSPKFKISSYVGSRGRKVLLLGNRKFDSHIEASKKRDQHRDHEKDSASKEVKRLFKPLKHIQEIDMKSGFVWAATRMVSISGTFEGILSVKRNLVIFHGTSQEKKQKRIELDMSNIEFIFSKYLADSDIACEIFTSSQRSYFFVFGEGQREKFYTQIWKSVESRVRDGFKHEGKKFNFFASLRKVCNCIYQTLSPSVIITKLRLVELWQSYEITTYEYLYYLNMLSGRSFNCSSQYPIYPWLIREVEKNVIDLQDPLHFRDLGVCCAALSESRKEKALTQWHALTGDMAEEDCQWRLHYLPAAQVFEYLIRFEPFVTQHILLQNHKFDIANRLFFSIPLVWEAMYNKGPSGKESIPEFYTIPQFLVNENHYDLGILEDRVTRVNDVVLPAWAKNNYHYVSVNRIALESPHVSATINKWIDLIFGVYRDDEAHWTVFHPHMYPEKVTRPETVEQKRATMLQFGAIPTCLFETEHPCRPPWTKTPPPPNIKLDHLVVKMHKQIILCENSIIIDARTQDIRARQLPKNGFGHMWGVSRSLSLVVFGTGKDLYVSIYSLSDQSVHKASHDLSLITCAAVVGGNFLITGGSDGSLRLWKLAPLELISVSTLHCDSLTAVSGCAEIGLIVSIDRGNHMIFETMFQHEFIRIVKLPTHNKSIPRISVFKSGFVVVAYSTRSGSEMLLYDVRGDLLKTVVINTHIVEVHKYYDFATREYLFLSIDTGDILMYDVTTMQRISLIQIQSPRSMFCPCKNARALIFESSDEVQSHDFDASIEFIFESLT